MNRELEELNELNPDSEMDLFALHHAFTPILTKEIAQFVESWNHHKLRTECNMTPLQLFISGLKDVDDDMPADSSSGSVS